MLLAGRVQLAEVLGRLASLRPVFHSEADLQQAFAWEARTLDPSLRVRLETRPEPGVRLDLLLTGEDGSWSAVELKYLVRLWQGEVAGERFELKNQGAEDIRAYDVVKDVVRVERFVTSRADGNGPWSAWRTTRRTGARLGTAERRTRMRSASTRGPCWRDPAPGGR